MPEMVVISNSRNRQFKNCIKWWQICNSKCCLSWNFFISNI